MDRQAQGGTQSPEAKESRKGAQTRVQGSETLITSLFSHQLTSLEGLWGNFMIVNYGESPERAPLTQLSTGLKGGPSSALDEAAAVLAVLCLPSDLLLETLTRAARCWARQHPYPPGSPDPPDPPPPP
ncbi:hypothetical protein ACOMHN_058177 [Nucella lapillus]